MQLKPVPNCEICTDPSDGKAKHEDGAQMNVCSGCFDSSSHLTEWLEKY